MTTERALTWKSHGENKWGLKISKDNYVFVVITPLAAGKYVLKYIDAELSHYTSNEKEVARIAAGLGPNETGRLALAVMEHYGHYEWVETFNSLEELAKGLDEQTSFSLKHLQSLTPYAAAIN